MWPMFRKQGAEHAHPRLIIDDEDGGTPRCPECLHEVVDEECTGCGLHYHPEEVDIMAARAMRRRQLENLHEYDEDAAYDEEELLMLLDELRERVQSGEFLAERTHH